jgi:predicted transcriptional regulator
MAEESSGNLRDLVAEVAAAYFANSHVGVGEIGTVIERIAAGLSGVGSAPAEAPPGESAAPAPSRATPAQIRRSLTSAALISFEDGRPYKTLRRHLATRGLSPEQYREKWGLPKDYPMVSPDYSARRSELAKSLRLGSRREPPAAAETPAPKRRGRRSAAESS